MDLMATASRENGIRVVNPLAEFRAAFKRGESLYLPGDLHFNANGHALFAKKILEAVAEMNNGNVE